MFPFISVILAVKNEEKHIKQSIDSLLAQDYPNYEIIVVDNYSTDRTYELLKEYKDRIIILKNEIPGPSASRNMAVSSAKGEYIAFTDGDCITEPDWLKELYNGFDNNDNTAGVGGIQKSPDNETYFGRLVQDFLKVCGFVSDYVKSPSIKHKIKNTNHNPSCNVMYKKEIFNDAGLFNESLWPGEDVELDYKIRKKGHILKFNPKAIVYHYRPDTFYKFLKMMFRYGYVQAVLLKKFGPFRMLHFIAILKILFLILLILSKKLGLIVISISLFLIIVYYIIIIKKIFRIIIISIMSLFAFICWNIGFYKGLITGPRN
ncbi:glycosyltransferase [bacterium]